MAELLKAEADEATKTREKAWVPTSKMVLQQTGCYLDYCCVDQHPHKLPNNSQTSIILVFISI
ncbi:hypothetical protein Hanom_Chr09g00841401 [Helianthus anomalus]